MAKILGIIVILVLAAGGYFLYTQGNFGQPSIEEIRKFYRTDIPDYKEDNALIAALGLSAPASEVDSYSWALDIVEREQVLLSGDFENLPGTLHFQAEWDGLGCWLANNAPADKPCYTAPQVAQLADYNNILLQRFESLSSYSNFVLPPRSQSFYMRDMVNGEKLFLANMIANPGNQEEDLQRWMANNRMLRNAMTDYNSWIDRAIVIVLYNMSLNQLQVILNGNKELAVKYKSSLHELLAPFGPDQMNITNVVKADYLMPGPICERLGEYCERKLYGINQGLIALANVPGPDFAKANKKFQDKYPSPDGSEEDISLQEMAVMIKNSPEHYSDMFLSGIVAVSDMIDTMRASDARLRILNLYIDALASGMDHSQIPEYIQNSPPDLHDPFTGKPFIYNPSEGTLTFSWSRCKETNNCSIPFN